MASKSNRSLAIKSALLCSLYCIATNSIPASNPSKSGWKLLRPDGAHFSVNVPGDYEVSLIVRPTTDGRPVHEWRFWSETGDQTYKILAADKDDISPTTYPAKVLNFMATTAHPPSEITANGLKMTEVLNPATKAGGTSVRARSCAINGHGFVFIETSPQMPKGDDEFFGSIKISSVANHHTQPGVTTDNQVVVPPEHQTVLIDQIVTSTSNPKIATVNHKETGMSFAFPKDNTAYDTGKGECIWQGDVDGSHYTVNFTRLPRVYSEAAQMRWLKEKTGDRYKQTMREDKMMKLADLNARQYLYVEELGTFEIMLVISPKWSYEFVYHTKTDSAEKSKARKNFFSSIHFQ